MAYAEDDTKAACKKAANMFYMHGEADAARVWYLAAIRYCRVEVEYWEMFMRFVLLFIEWGNFPRAQYTAIEGLKHKHDFNMDSFTENTLHSTIGLTSIRYRSFTHAALRVCFFFFLFLLFYVIGLRLYVAYLFVVLANG